MNCRVEHIDHKEGVGDTGVPETSISSLRSPRQGSNCRVEHIDHKEGVEDTGVPETSISSLRSPRQGSNCRVEHIDHKEGVGDTGVPETSLSSLRSPRQGSNGRVEHKDRKGNFLCSLRSPRQESNGRVEHIDHKENSLSSLRSPRQKGLLDEVRQIAYDLHVYLGIGLLEKVYENGLKHRLELAGHKVEAQKPLKVYDRDGFLLGDYFADLFVDDSLIIELKSTKNLAPQHLAQVLNYLKITKLQSALLINFGSFQFECRSVVNGGDGNA